jgi:aminoglycoside phosphotransferase (APT) family kinase protein
MTTPQWTADIEIDAALALRLIRDQFSEVPAQRIRPLGAGWDNEAFLVDERFVFRFPRRRVAGELIEREVTDLPQIAGSLPLAISAPRYVGRPVADYPWVFAGYEQIEGTTACSFPLTDATRSALAGPLGAFLRALHDIEPQPFVDRGLPPDQLARLDHAKRLAQTRARVAALTARDVEGLGACVEWLTSNPPAACVDEQRRIVHGDLYARHVVLDEAGCAAGVIDWGDVHLGNPALDLAIAHLVLPATAHASFRAVYGPIGKETWNAARYRAIYHAILELDYGKRVHDAAMQACGTTALHLIGAGLD